jgi:hypothetical protein
MLATRQAMDRSDEGGQRQVWGESVSDEDTQEERDTSCERVRRGRGRSSSASTTKGLRAKPRQADDWPARGVWRRRRRARDRPQQPWRLAARLDARLGHHTTTSTGGAAERSPGPSGDPTGLSVRMEGWAVEREDLRDRHVCNRSQRERSSTDLWTRDYSKRCQVAGPSTSGIELDHIQG